MPYRYEAAPGYQAPRSAKPAPRAARVSSASSHYRTAHSTPVSSVVSHAEDNAWSTRESGQPAQPPTVHTPADTRGKGVRFTRAEETSSAHLYPGGQSRVPTTPVSPRSAYTSSPRAPSLSHSTDGEHEDDMACPPTPEHAPVPPPRADAKATKSKSKFPLPASSPHEASFAAIDRITYEMTNLVLSFQFPHDLEFEPAPLNSRAVPKLTFGSKNRALHGQNQKLEKLQSRLDAIESHGDANVRKARREAVTEVERALEDLKRMQAMVWTKRVYEQREKHRT